MTEIENWHSRNVKYYSNILPITPQKLQPALGRTERGEEPGEII